MPKLVLCRHPGCNQLSEESFCEKHRNRPKQNWRDAKTAPFANATRSNQGMYDDPRWKQIRAEAIKRDGYRCCRCGCKDKLTVHHKIPPRGNEDLFFCLDNTETICAGCHRTETARECKERK